jgi:hypothetical protein
MMVVVENHWIEGRLMAAGRQESKFFVERFFVDHASRCVTGHKPDSSCGSAGGFLVGRVRAGAGRDVKY